MFIIAAGGNALFPLGRVGAHKRARFTIPSVVFRCAFCPSPGLAGGLSLRGEEKGEEGTRGARGRPHDGTPTAIIT